MRKSFVSPPPPSEVDSGVHKLHREQVIGSANHPTILLLVISAACRAAGALLLEPDGMRDFMCWVEALESTSCPPALKELLLRNHTAGVSTPVKGAGGVDVVGSGTKPAMLSSRVSVPPIQPGRASPLPGRNTRSRRCSFPYFPFPLAARCSV